jgi:uncharacterized membrane protein YcaP (DUF421 family)
MDMLHSIVGPDDGGANPAQMFVRVALLFVFGIFCTRLAGRRTFAQYSPLDIIVAIVVGSNISRIMTGKAPLVLGMGATLLLVILHRVVAMLTLRWPALGRLMKGRPAILVQDGRIDHHALRRHQLTEDDLHEGLRIEKVGDVAKVGRATLEGGGKISVVQRDE